MKFAEFSFKDTVRRCFAFILTVVIALSSVVFMPHLKNVYAGQFNMGTENHWAEPYMKKLYNEGLMSGDSNGNMNPDKNITRAEFVSIINRAFGYDNTSTAAKFKDIKGYEWYANDITAAYNAGYFSGDGKNSADPNGNLTREQAVSLICRNTNIKEIDGDNTTFADGKNIANWSIGYVNAASKKGYISGYSDNTFRPENPITRGEAAKMFSDAIGDLVNKSGTTSLGYKNGNVTISASGVTLENTVINGDLYITAGVGLGHTYFNNVHVNGDVIVSGTGESYAGESSVEFNDSTLANLIVTGKNGNVTKSVKLNGTSTVNSATISTDAYLEELAYRAGGFKNVVLDGVAGTALHLSGVFDQVTVKGEKNKLSLDDGTIKELIVDEESTDSNVNIDDDSNVDKLLLDVGTNITGNGEISYVKANAAGTKISSLPDEVEIRPGLTANIDGKDMTSNDADELELNPRILTGYPEMTDIGQSDATAVFETNKPGRVYWVVTDYDNKNVSSDDIINPGKYNSDIIKSGNLNVTSSKEYSVKISGLTADSEYVLSAVFVDEKDDNSPKKRETFTTIDTSTPNFLTGYPKVSEVSNTSASVDYVTTKDVTLYWALFPKTGTAPDVKAFKDQKFFGDISNGKKEDVDKYKEGTISLSGLKELQDYSLYLFITDGSKDSSIKSLDIKTVDKTAPQFNLGYPKIESEDKTSAQISLSVDEDGTVYYAVYDGGTTFPVPNQDGSAVDINSNEAKQQVISGKGAVNTYSQGVKADATTSVKVAGLDATKDYDIYFVAEDKSKNLSEIKKLSIGAKPDFLSGYPKISSINSTYAEVAIDVTKDCKAYWAVLPKGSVAPTNSNLKSQVISGATNFGIVDDCKKNIESTVKIDKLKEYADYDIYAMVSDGTTDSNISKITLKTTDLTPPAFSNGYPMIGTVTDKSVEVKLRVNEAGSIYYVLCKKGDEFPVPTTLGGDKPSLDSDEAKNQVVSGSNGYKSGKTTIKQNTETSMTIAGLDAETPYDLYLVAVDGFNNISTVKYMEIKTLDKTAPTAALEFEETISGDVVAGSEIRIKFSEEVIDNISKARLPLVSADVLANDIVLYDKSALKTTAVSIDFTKAMVADVDGKTVVTFPKGTLNLNSGNTYQFELNNIADTSDNRMDEKTLLPAFNTVAPMVEIDETVASTGMDMTFNLTPEVSETNDNIYYDIIFTSNEKVEFEVYEKPEGGSFAKVTGTSDNPQKIIVEKGKSISLQNIKDKILSEKDDYDFVKFKDLKQTEYGIKIISIDGDTNKKGWSSTVQFNVQCIIGSYSGLSPVADNPTDRLSEAISDGKATVVSYPKDFSVKVYFTDTIVPEFETGYPELDYDNDSTNGLSQVGDTLIRPIIKTTKSCTFYYLIAKTGTVTDPTSDGIMEGKYKPQDGKYGNFSVASGETEYEFRIEGLNPEVNYTMYCFLKGTPAAPSEMKVINFTTVKVAAPKIQTAVVRDRLENSAIIDISLDKEATVDWIVFNRKSMPNPDAVDGDMIRQKEENIDYKPIDFGSATAVIGKGDTLAKTAITIQNLDKDVYYDFYAVAKSPSGGGDSTILRIQNITPADKTSPQVIVTTVITNYGTSYAEQPYSGEVTLTFSEPMYYIVNEGDPLLPLDIKAFEAGLSYGNFDLEFPNVVVDSYTTSSTDSGVRAIKSITLKFSKVYNNSTINYVNLLSDSSTNVAGSLHMTFVDMELQGQNRAKSYWNYEFINN